MDYSRIKTLQKQVECMLAEYPDARNSDIWLTQAIWATFYPQFIRRNAQKEPAILLKNLRDLPTQDAIKRVRAKLQNDDKKYPPTILKIALTRGFSEAEWRAALGYKNNKTNEKTDQRGGVEERVQGTL